ncbi:hypothetical protein H5410_046636 [Solanum commersonii]|uniref:Uncharacterized protein n=1 Tax=Solanum commersonii TaxID=4109 RepID=A0A9J5XEU9_SOLCO|nr:hypothetical protein H5410_046636 [Solanum commersonii]
MSSSSNKRIGKLCNKLTKYKYIPKTFGVHQRNNNGEKPLLGKFHEFLTVPFRNPGKTRIVLVVIQLL